MFRSRGFYSLVKGNAAPGADNVPRAVNRQPVSRPECKSRGSFFETSSDMSIFSTEAANVVDLGVDSRPRLILSENKSNKMSEYFSQNSFMKGKQIL